MFILRTYLPAMRLNVLDPSQASVGTVVYAPEKSAFVWKIKQLGGAKEYLMRAHFGLPSVRSGTCRSTCARIKSVLKLSVPAVIRGDRQAGPDLRQVRDSILHCVRYPGQIPEDCGKEWISGITLG
jgi:hypothetical protein